MSQTQCQMCLYPSRMNICQHCLLRYHDLYCADRHSVVHDAKNLYGDLSSPMMKPCMHCKQSKIVHLICQTTGICFDCLDLATTTIYD